MISIAVILLAGAPDFSPLRGHEWGESREQAQVLENNSSESTLDRVDGIETPFLKYTLPTQEPVLYFALGFEQDRLTRVIYPVNIPSRDAGTEPDLVGSAERFFATRAWLAAHFGEPSVFKSSDRSTHEDFTSSATLVDAPDYEIHYTWCHPSAAAHLYAGRSERQEPIIVAGVESPERPPDPKDIEKGIACRGKTP